jgi:hypothetical protein
MNKFFNKKGSILVYALVFGAVFSFLIAGLLGFILMQQKHAAQRVAWNQSLHIAESGINYYRWCLNNGTEDQCEGEKEYYDSFGSPVGKFSVQSVSVINCEEVVKRDIISTGWTYDFPDVKRKVGVFYGRVSVAKYSYLINDNVWAGSDREIRGIYHSNGGIRMDGENQSLVSSAQEEWFCTDSFGCSPCPTGDGCRIEGSNCICPGVFTTTNNADTNLFSYPALPFDFDGITIDLADIKSKTQANPQKDYWPPVTDVNANGKGYHIKFVNDGTFEVWIITNLSRIWGYNEEEGWHYDYFSIADEYFHSSHVISPGCPLIFVEDNLWLEGEVKGKVTIASADLITPGKETSIILPEDIDYTVLDGSDGLGVISQNNILISPDSPNRMELRGIFIAQKGRFGINHYSWNIKDKLEIYGSIVSNKRVGTQWTSSGAIVSGYRERENYFDSNLIYEPPPFIPYASSDFEIMNWEEIE